MVILEFRKEDHEENMNLLHRIKKDICTLYDKLEASEKESMGQRHYEIDSFDERRGGMNYRGGMGERRGGGRGGRMGRREDIDDRRYPMYPFDERGGGRYDY